MKKNLIAMFVFLSVMISTVANAYYTNIINEVVEESPMLYTVYMGMPEQDFLSSWNNVPGWHAVQDGSQRYSFEKKRENVFVQFSVALHQGYISFYRISFFTNSKVDADDIHRQIIKKLREKWGEGRYIDQRDPLMPKIPVLYSHWDKVMDNCYLTSDYHFEGKLSEFKGYKYSVSIRYWPYQL